MPRNINIKPASSQLQFTGSSVHSINVTGENYGLNFHTGSSAGSSVLKLKRNKIHELTGSLMINGYPAGGLYGGSGNIPNGTVANIVEHGTFFIKYFGGSECLYITTDDGSKLASPDGRSYIFVSDGAGTHITSNDVGAIYLDPNTGILGIRDDRTAPRGIEYEADYSLDVVLNDRSIPDVGTVKQIARPYKIYSALVEQFGSNDPVVTVLENTLGDDIIWTREASGEYHGTARSNIFTIGRTITFTQYNGSGGDAKVGLKLFPMTKSKIVLTAYDAAEINLELDTDPLSCIEIRVYPE